MRERRREQRKNLAAYTQVYDVYGGGMLGYLGDLTLTGAMVIGEKSLAQNYELSVAIELPELPNIEASRITIPARVAWCQPDISPEYFNVGFEFKTITPIQEKIILSIIENYEFKRDAPKYHIKPISPNK
jgi:hypothetical protein